VKINWNWVLAAGFVVLLIAIAAAGREVDETPTAAQPMV
jgi:hypothetical protein